jgi:hypothetical protein
MFCNRHAIRDLPFGSKILEWVYLVEDCKVSTKHFQRANIFIVLWLFYLDRVERTYLYSGRSQIQVDPKSVDLSFLSR